MSILLMIHIETAKKTPQQIARGSPSDDQNLANLHLAVATFFLLASVALHVLQIFCFCPSISCS